MPTCSLAHLAEERLIPEQFGHVSMMVYTSRPVMGDHDVQRFPQLGQLEDLVLPDVVDAADGVG